jgi:hypothetical protein
VVVYLLRGPFEIRDPRLLLEDVFQVSNTTAYSDTLRMFGRLDHREGMLPPRCEKRSLTYTGNVDMSAMPADSQVLAQGRPRNMSSYTHVIPLRRRHTALHTRGGYTTLPAR